MHLGTINGPTRLGPLSRATSNACSKLAVLGPPDPATRPVLGVEISLAVRPASKIACSIAKTE